MNNRSVQSKLAVLLFSRNDGDFVYFVERFEAWCHLKKLGTVLLDKRI